jgi:hypothetical protein
VTRRGLDVSSVPHGPQDPLTATAPRRVGSVRRTTSIDQRFGGPGPHHVVAGGRDVRTGPDGGAEVVDRACFEATIETDGTVSAIQADPPEPRLAGLVGGHVSRGLRRRIDELLPEHRTRHSVLHQLLDDLPMANLISGYGSSREQPEFQLPPGSADRLTDLCAGWVGGGTMLGTLEDTGVFPLPIGPPAPDLSPPGDPDAWHELPPMAPRSVRRRRRLDLIPGQPQVVDVHFRDSHLGVDAVEDVLHEYTLVATLDGGLTILGCDASVRVLPWPECPNALGSAARVVGQPVSALRDLISTRFTGTSTCTHLNDVLRSLAGVTTLAEALP